MIVVFYDGGCGLCRREIHHYQRIAPKDMFTWVDIATTPMPFTSLGYTVAEGMKALHVRDANGVMYKGVDGFIMLWRQLPGWFACLAYTRWHVSCTTYSPHGVSKNGGTPHANGSNPWYLISGGSNGR